MSRAAITLLAIILLPLVATPVQAEVRRCTAPDGGIIYTDRRCGDIGAIDRRAAPAGTAATGRLYRAGCSRSLQDLAFELSAAIEARDVNRLAGVYHWVGVSSGTANALMGRLQAIVQRPLVDLEPVLPRAFDDSEPLPMFTPEGDVILPPRRPARAPVGIRLHQTFGKSATPTQTHFGLTRHFGCWWLRL